MVIKANLFHRFIYMANSSAYSPSLATGLAHLVSEKLTKGNHLFWKVVLTIHAAQLASYLDGTKPAPPKMVEVTKEDKTVATISNPEFATWEAQDQLVLGYLLSSISREILVYVAAMKTSAEVCQAIDGMFASQSRAHVINTRLALATTQKGNLSVAAYVNKMKGYADDTASAGRSLDDGELKFYKL